MAGNESVLFSAVEAEAEKRAEQYAIAQIINPMPVTAAAGESASGKGRISLPWNPGSSISSLTLIQSAENWLGQINDAVLVCSPPALYRPVEALVPAEIETRINTQIKGWFFLVRELALYFRARSSGTLALVLPETGPAGGESPSDLLGSSASASFHSLVQGLLSCASAEPFKILGFLLSGADQEKEFSAWLFKILDEGSRKNSGKWHKYNRFTLLK